MNGDMTVREAGKRGGAKVKEKYGRAHYQEMGRKGGSKRKVVDLGAVT